MFESIINKVTNKIYKTIKYEGDNRTIIWKHPDEFFDSTSQLIVGEMQEAVFFKDGQVFDLFTPGRYTLDSKSIPLIGEFLNKVVSSPLDDTPFSSELYFINKAERMNIKWGTDSKVEYLEPTYNFPISVGACGEMCLKVSDSKKMLMKLIGTVNNQLTWDFLTNYFRAILMNKIKPYMAKFLKENLINIFEIDSHLDVFSEELKKLLINDFEEYGFSLEKFLVTTVVKPDSDRQFMKFKDLYFRRFADIAEATINQKVSLINAQTEAQKLIINSKAQVQASNLIQDKQIDRSSYFLSNDESIKQLPNFESGKIDSSNHSNQLAYAEQKKEIIKCPKCNTELPARAKFCFECGYKIELLKDNEVICPKCGEKTYKGKFCSLCGALLINKCPKCDMEIPPNAKFCLNCGEKL